MAGIGDFLPAEKLAALRNAYDRAAMTGLLSKTLPGVYAPSAGWVASIIDAFYGAVPDESDGVKLSRSDRERCIIALLASRREEFDLVVHIYVALMEGVSPEEIANIMMLAGIYTGVDVFSNGLGLEQKTLTLLAARVDAHEPLEALPVLTALREKFSQ